ncbi:MAG: hypothetical protein IPM82_01375 [Saprospiraceae bacterium]|nr:hypothetical protein [Saprospiraceae bacterium]
MSFGYGAFGSQEWIRKIKPKPYFQSRKSPAGDTGEIGRTPDYQMLLNKKSRGVEMESWEDTPSTARNWPIVLLLFLALALTILILLWIS